MKHFPAIICMLCMLLLGACRQESSEPDFHVSGSHYRLPSSISFLALGDSFTFGQNVNPDDRWPIQLADTLHLAGIDVSTSLIAHPNWTTALLLEGIKKADLSEKFDMVSLSVGMHNQSTRVPLEKSREEFVELLKKAIAFTGGQSDRVFVLSIPDYSFTPYAAGLETARISSEIKTLNQMQKSICESAGITWFDITPITQQVKIDPVLVSDDDFHPSAKMYARWVEIMYPKIIMMLEIG